MPWSAVESQRQACRLDLRFSRRAPICYQTETRNVRPMTTPERNRLSLVVDGYQSLAKTTWAVWGVLLFWRIVVWIMGQGSIGDVTLFALFVLIPIAVAGLADGATSGHRADLKGGVAAGLSASVDEVGSGYLIVKGEQFEVPKRISEQVASGDMVAVEFAPTTRLVLQVHRLQNPSVPKQIAESASDETPSAEVVEVD